MESGKNLLSTADRSFKFGTWFNSEILLSLKKLHNKSEREIID